MPTVKLLCGAVLTFGFAASALAQERAFNAADLGAVLAGKPQVDGPNKVMRTFVANRSQLQVLTITKIKLHHHALEDHIVYVAKGAGSGRFEMAPGDLLVLTTDGFFEWANTQDEQFGLARLQEAVRSARHLQAGEIIRQLHAAVVEFVGGTDQQDDLTAVVVKRTA